MTIRMLLITVAIGGVLAGAGPEQAVLDTEKAWGRALGAGDVAKLDQLMASDLTYDHSSGNRDSKETYIAKIRSGEQKYENFVYDEDMKARVYGDAAVVNAAARMTSITDGKSNALHLRLIHVYVKRDGRWQMVAHQSTRLPN